MSDKTTFEIMMQAHEIINQMMHNEGEVSEEIDSQIDQFLGDSADKLERHRFVVDDAQAQADRLKAQAARFTAEARKFENTAKRVKAHARTLLESRVELRGWDDGRRVDTDQGPVYLSRRTGLTIEEGKDKQVIEMLRVQHPELIKTKESIDRTALKLLLVSGALTTNYFDGIASIENRVSVTFK